MPKMAGVTQRPAPGRQYSVVAFQFARTLAVLRALTTRRAARDAQGTSVQKYFVAGV
jgi:hypothetical protein